MLTMAPSNLLAGPEEGVHVQRDMRAHACLICITAKDAAFHGNGTEPFWEPSRTPRRSAPYEQATLKMIAP